MYCIHCGTQIPDKSTFCLKCGKPQLSGVQADEHKWETCEICFEHPDLGYGQYWAKAIDSDGEYNAGESTAIRRLDTTQSPENTEVVKALINQLVQDGWEQIDTRGIAWYSYRFQRPLTRACPRCTSTISIRATRCPKCTSEITAIVRQRKQPLTGLLPDIPVIFVQSKPPSSTIPTATPPSPSAPADSPEKQDSVAKKDKGWLRKLFGG